MFKSFLLVGLGSFFGGGLRYLVSAAMKSVCAAGFPWGTLVVNLVGCFVIGLLLALFGRWSMLASSWYLLFITGFSVLLHSQHLPTKVCVCCRMGIPLLLLVMWP